MISKLHYITQDLPTTPHWVLAEEACKGGVDWVQLRVKNKSGAEWKEIALKTLEVCRRYNAKLIINDNAHLAKEIGADGVHLGKGDLSPIEARKLLGSDFIIGGTSNTLEDIRLLHQAGVDYIGLGPFRFTSTKEKLSPILGFAGYSALMHQCRNEGLKLPVIGIGGIRAEDIQPLLQSGLYGIAVSSAINLADNKPEAVKLFIEKLAITT